MIKKSEDEESSLKKELQQYKRKTEVLTGVIQRMGSLYSEIEKKTQQLEVRSLRRNLVVIGLQSEDNISKCMKIVDNFSYTTTAD